MNLAASEVVNYVKEIYAPFTDEEISAKIAEMLKTENINADVEVIYQKVEDLHKENAEIKAENAELKARLAKIEALLFNK